MVVAFLLSPTAIASPPAPLPPTAGVYVIATLALPDDELKQLLDESRTVGYPVVLRGLWQDSLRATLDRLKDLVGEQGERAPAITIDAPLVRSAHADLAPALVLRGTGHRCLVAGRRSLADLASAAARQWPAFRPWADHVHQRLRRASKSDQPSGTAMHPPWPGEPPDCLIQLDPPPLPLAERDLAEALREAVAKHDWRNELARAKARAEERLAMGPGVVLPRARREERHIMDPTVEVRERIVDPRTQQVLAHPGQRLNPLTMLPLQGEVWILDATDPDQVRWVEDRLKTTRAAYLLVTRGDVRTLTAQWNRPVQWATPELLDRLHVTSVPAVVRSLGTVLEVHYYAIDADLVR